jgi:UPF0755 protein
MKKSKVALIAVLVVILCAGVYSGLVIKDMTGVAIKEGKTIKIEEKTGAGQIADQLKKERVIKYPLAFKIKAKLSGYSARFKPGSLTVQPDMSYTDIMDALITPNRGLSKVTIPEGYELRQIEDKLFEAGLIDREKFKAALDPSLYDYKFLKNIPDRENKLEGYLFPDTYNIAKGTSEKDIVNMMLRAFDKNFKPEYYDRAKQLDMTVDEIVTLASIIERETNNAEERPVVAGVFYNRIHDNMRLQSCATVQYILKERKANLSNSDVKIKSPYNTYMNAGLPIGPIAAPGANCIAAALYPEETTAKFFVLGKDGKHIFSDTYEEHEKAKREAGQ